MTDEAKQANLPIFPEMAPAPVAKDEDERFDWSGEDVILEHQPATAVYRNTRDGVVIRQEAGMYEAEDHFVHFTSDEHVRSLIKALQREIGDA